MGGGKTSTSSSTVSIPPEVLARYNAVNAQAEQVAQTPFQQYSTDPNAFVAPINQTQQSGINQIQSNMGSAQPYYDVATGLTMAGAGPANLGQLNTNQYMSPYLQNVVGTTLAAQQMQNAQQASQLQGQQATQGAFGGDRGNIGLSNLAYQQNLANQQALAGQLQSGYTQAQNTAAQQQGAQLAAQQANLARLTQAGQAIGGLGTAAQNAAITGGQAALTAGTVPQQTQQAGLTALYNQFLQQQGYPFQTAQFLANIAEGTGALSGSTTTTTGPAPFFSDERLKDDVETIGKTFDGQKIVKFRYKGQHGPKQIGLVAQDVEKHHPEAVGEQNGYKTVDYDKATDEAARRGHYYAGGLVPNSQGGAVGPEHAGLGFAGGGLVDPMDLQQLVAARAQMYAPYASGGLYGQQGGSTPGAKGVVPSGNLPTPKLVTASTPSTQQTPVGKQIMSDIGDLKEGVSDFSWAKQGLMGTPAQSYTKDGSTYTTPAQPGLISQAKSWLDSSQKQPSGNARGGVIGRYHYDDGGEVDDNKDHAIPYGGDSIVGEVAKEGEKSPQMLKAAQTTQSGGQGSTAGNLLGAATTLKGLYGLGSDVAGGLGNLAGGFNAATNAGTLDSVLGSGFTAENIGLGAGGASAAGTGLMGSIGSGLGSFFSSLGPAAMFLPFKDGGVVPRQHKGDGGPSDNSNTSDQNDNSVDYTPIFQKASDETGIPAKLLIAQAKQESGLNPNAPNGGMMQILKSTAKNPGYGLDPIDPDDLKDPEKNIMFGARYLKAVGDNAGVKDWSDPTDASKALLAYNGGGDPNYIQNVYSHMGVKGIGTPSQPSSGQQSSGILAGIGKAADNVGDWYNRNQNWLVPLAEGLGTMASSPSRYLGAAVLQGIGGAAQASQNLQRNQALIGQEQASTLKTNIEAQQSLAKLNQVRAISGLSPITSLQEYQQRITNGTLYSKEPNATTKQGASSAQQPQNQLVGPQLPASPAEPQTTGGQTNATIRALNSPDVQQTMSGINWDNVSPSNNIPVLQQELIKAKQLENTAPDQQTFLQAQQRQFEINKQISDIVASKQLIMKDSSVQPVPQWVDTANRIEMQKARIAKDADSLANTDSQLTSAGSDRQKYIGTIDRMQSLLENLQTGPLEDLKSQATSIADALGMQVDPSKLQERSDIERFSKEAIKKTFGDVSQIGGRLFAKELETASKSNPSINLQPQSNRALISQMKAGVVADQQFYDDYLNWKQQNPTPSMLEYQNFVNNWMKDPNHRMNNFFEKAYAETPVKGDFPVPESRKAGYQYVLPPGSKFPNGAIATWDGKGWVSSSIRPIQ